MKFAKEGKILADAMAARGHTPESLAAALGLKSKHNIEDAIKGRRHIPQKHRAKTTDFVGIDVVALYAPRDPVKTTKRRATKKVAKKSETDIRLETLETIAATQAMQLTHLIGRISNLENTIVRSEFK